MKLKSVFIDRDTCFLSKLIRIMKLTGFLIFVSLMQLTASVYSQNKLLSLDMKSTALKDVFREIENQSEFTFLYNNAKVDVNKTVNAEFQSVNVEDILNQLLSGTGIGFVVIDKQIVLAGKDQLAIAVETAQQQGKKVTGKVTDSSGGSLPGVSVVVKGTTTGVITDNNGTFSIANVPENATLQFSFVGMKMQEVTVGSKTSINISLSEETIGIEEVVAIGYGTQNKKTSTGSMSNVKSEDLNTVNAVSIDNLLQGKAAGLNISSRTAQPGGGLTINIRGSLSPNGSNSPLYVIDGVPITNNSRVDNFGNGQTTFWGGTDRNSLNTINPNDIESVDILKDASASAIYGSAAANGVVLITTKRGKEQKTTVTYSGTYSIQTPKKYLQPLNSSDFMKYHELYGEEYWKLNKKIAPYGNVDPSKVSPYSPLFSPTDITNAANGINNNWVDYLVQDGMINDQNISIAGGSQNTKVYTSFSYLDQSALLKNSDLTRFSGRLNLDQKLGSKILLKLGLSYSQIKNQNMNTGNQADPDSPSPIQSAIRYAPNFDIYKENGNLTQSYLIRTPNPQSWLMIGNTTTTSRLFFTPSLDVDITKDLKATVSAGIDQSRSDNDFYVPVGAQFQTVLLGYAQLATNFIANYSTEGYLTYNKNFGVHRLSVVVGAGYYKTKTNNYGLQGVDFFTDAFETAQVSIAANKDKNAIYSGRSERTKISQFMRVNYTLLDKYILTFNGRNDGSSIWAEGQKWGFFPGISGAWIVNQEKFMQSLTALNQLKIRVGYGTVGNEGMLGNYSLSTYGPYGGWTYPFGGKLSPGVLQTQLGNPQIHWEKDVTVNAGIDFGLFKNRISGSVDYFVRTAHDLFNFRYLPSNNAIGRIGANVGSTRSKGIEILLKTENIKTKDFSWNTDITFSTNKSYWIERSNPEDLLKTPWVGKNDEIRAVYGWKTNGLIRSVSEIPEYQSGANVGNVKYLDLNNDKKLDEKDVAYLGSTDPKAFYGFGNTFTYKSFDLNVFLYGTLGGLQGDNWRLIGAIGGSVGLYNQAPSNAEVHVLNTWSTFNPNGSFPGIAPEVVGSAKNPSKNNDFGMRKVDWGRLKNITLGYNLPSDLLKKTRFIQSVRVFVDVQNLAVFGNYSGLDPEMELNSNFPYPIAQTTAFGLNVKF